MLSQLLKCKKRVTFDRRRSQKVILRFDFCLEPQYFLKYKSHFIFFNPTQIIKNLNLVSQV